MTTKKKYREPKIAIPQFGNKMYLDAIRRAGGRPVVVDADTLLSDFDRMAGLLIPGGRDVWPGWYGEEFGPKTQPSDLDRDSLEIAFIKRALNTNIPVLGVCRGHQLLNVAMGGSLHQHIRNHEGFRHMVKFNKDSEHLGHIRESGFLVNSLHHQAIDRLAPGLRIAALSHDGIIEAVEGTGDNFVVGVQFHPEMAWQGSFGDEADRLFRKFVHIRKPAKKEVINA